MFVVREQICVALNAKVICAFLFQQKKTMSERNLETENYISIPQEGREDVLAMNTC